MKKVWRKVLGVFLLSPAAALVIYFVVQSIKVISHNFILLNLLKYSGYAIVLVVVYLLLRYMIDLGWKLIRE